MVDARPLDVGAARELLDELRDFVASHTADNPRRRALHARIASLAASLATLAEDRQELEQRRADDSQNEQTLDELVGQILSDDWYTSVRDRLRNLYPYLAARRAAPDPERSTPT